MKKQLLCSLICLSSITLFASSNQKKVDAEVAAFLARANGQNTNAKSPASSPDNTTPTSPRHHKSKGGDHHFGHQGLRANRR